MDTKKLDNGLTEIKEFYDNGQIYKHYFLNENGKWHGELKWWREDGTLGGYSNYKNGKYHGEYKWWGYDGTLEKHRLWEDDKIIKDYFEDEEYTASNIMNNKTDLEFTDISSEEYRKYVYLNNEGYYELIINKPKCLNVSESGGHRILNEEGVSFYVPNKWTYIEWKAKDGEPNFVK